MPEARTFAARNAKIASETASRLPLIREPARPSWAISFLSMWRRCARRTITRPKNTQGGRLVLAGTHQGWLTRSRCNGSAPRHGGRVPQAQQSLPPPGPVRSLRHWYKLARVLHFMASFRFRRVGRPQNELRCRSLAAAQRRRAPAPPPRPQRAASGTTRGSAPSCRAMTHAHATTRGASARLW